ncbi:MAG: cytochrome ubiquinol oxidase subunit I [Anaerolineae bacterium]|nr:cytochrome ubiquinol oxidase subunit I [Anaerolineae bacterium]MDW8100381.1 cytochrome ubiquinol oxidase subunit I [Anaerolineae bacterium]
MEAVTLARWQFAITTVYHFFFVPLTLGLSVLVALMETIYVRSGNELYKQMAKFWGKLFLINFVMGVVTGIVQEFQFGMNWSEYSRFVGDIFGVPLAIEALLAFFLESTFLGIWTFGWDRLSKGLHALTIWLVALGSNLSALWILIANSFMQQPVGFIIRDGRAEMTDFSAVVLNPNIWVQFPHTVLAGFTTAAFFVLGISAYHLLRERHVDFFRRSFQMASIFGAFSIVMLIFNGHSQAQHIVKIQPMKMAAAEALWESEDPASFSILTIGDLAQRRDVFAIRIPRLLSLLAYNQLSGEVKGIYDLQAEYEQLYGPGDYIPPVAITYWSFRLMVGAGFAMLALALYALFLTMGEAINSQNRLLRAFLWAIPLPYIANTFGWLMTEIGRAPWVVYGVMRIEDAVSPTVSTGMVLASLILFTLIYGLLMFADIYLLVRFAKAGPEGETAETGPLVAKPARV